MASFQNKTLPTAAVLLSAVLLFSGCKQTSRPVPPVTAPSAQTAPAIPQETIAPEGTTAPSLPEGPANSPAELEFPLSLENGGLLLASPFSYDGLNPDCENTEGRNIAAVTVENHSPRHLLRAEFTLILSDGSELPFRIEHIPSGRAVTAFALDNSQIPADAQWSVVRISAQYAETDSLLDQGLSVQEDGMTVALFNDTGAELENLMIYCHNLLGEEYFGGKAYPYEINNISAGGTASVDALDCILGIAEVTYAAENHE